MLGTFEFAVNTGWGSLQLALWSTELEALTKPHAVSKQECLPLILDV